MARRNRTSMRLRRLAFAAVFVVAVLAVIVQTAPGVSQSLMPLRTQAGDLLVTTNGTAREPRQNPSLWARLMGQGEKERQIRELEARVQELSRYEAAARSMAARLEAYESLLSALGEPPARGITARVVSENGGPFSKSLLANAGAAQGVEPDAIALNEGGIVGRVTHLGERSARVLLVTDFNSRISILGETSGVRAIVFGDRDGLGTLSDLPEDDAFRPGERILTSGEGGVFPHGLMVGRAIPSDDGWRVAFTMAETRGGFVQLVPPVRIPTPEDEPVLMDLAAGDDLTLDETTPGPPQ